MQLVYSLRSLKQLMGIPGFSSRGRRSFMQHTYCLVPPSSVAAVMCFVWRCFFVTSRTNFQAHSCAFAHSFLVLVLVPERPALNGSSTRICHSSTRTPRGKRFWHHNHHRAASAIALKVPYSYHLPTGQRFGWWQYCLSSG